MNRKRGKVVILDDDPGILHMLQGMLLSGYARTHLIDVETFTSGAEALLHLDGASVVVTDLIMWPMDGFDFILDARRICPEAKFIVFSAFFDHDSEIDIINLSGDEPVSPHEFTSVIYKTDYKQLIDQIIAEVPQRPLCAKP